MWAPEQFFGKNENTPIAVMSNSTRQNQKDQSIHHLMEMRSKNDITDHFSNPNSLGGIYDLMNNKGDIDNKNKQKLIGKRVPGNRLIDNISFDGTLTIKQPKIENQNDSQAHLASAYVNQNQLFHGNQNGQNRQTAPLIAQISLNGTNSSFMKDQITPQQHLQPISRQNSNLLQSQIQQIQNLQSNVHLQQNVKIDNEQLDNQQIIGQFNIEAIDIKKLQDLIGNNPKIQGQIRNQNIMVQNQSLNVPNIIQPNNEIGNEILYGQQNNFKNGISLVKTNTANLSARSYNIISQKQSVDLQSQPKIHVNQRPQRILIDSQPIPQQNGPIENQGQSSLPQIKLCTSEGLTQLGRINSNSQVKQNGQWTQLMVQNQRMLPQIPQNQMNNHIPSNHVSLQQIPNQYYQIINQGIMQNNLQESKFNNLRLAPQLQEKLPFGQSQNSNEIESKLVKAVAQFLNQEKESVKQQVEAKQSEMVREKSNTIQETKTDRAASQVVDLNQKNQIQMQSPSKNRLVQGQSIGSKNNNSSGFSGYINSNSNSKSTVEKIQENLKEIKFIPIIFTVCPNHNNAEAAPKLKSNFASAMTTQERIQEEQNGNLIKYNLSNIKPIINIESQILAVMQHYNKQQLKEDKDKKHFDQKINNDDLDHQFKKDPNQDSGKNESRQTNDNKGDTTNSKEKDSKEGQKNSDQFFDFFNQEELIKSIDNYVRNQLKHILLKNADKSKENKFINQVDKAQSQKIPINQALNNTPSKAHQMQFQHQQMIPLDEQLNGSFQKLQSQNIYSQQRIQANAIQSNGATIPMGHQNELAPNLKKQNSHTINQNNNKTNNFGNQDQYLLNIDKLNNQVLYDQIQNYAQNNSKEDASANLQTQQQPSISMIEYFQMLQKQIDTNNNTVIDKDFIKILDKRVQQNKLDVNDKFLEKLELKNQKYVSGQQSPRQNADSGTMAQINEMGILIENEQKKILKTLQQLSDKPQLEQLLNNQNTSSQPFDTNQRINKEHMSQQMMPVNCSSFIMSSINSVTKAIQQKCPDSFNNGNPSSNSHVVRDSSNSHDSNGSLVFNNSNSQAEVGSTKQANIQKLHADNFDHRHAKSNGNRSPDDSGQSSVPNKGSKFSNDILQSEGLQQVPGHKEQTQNKQKEEKLDVVEQQPSTNIQNIVPPEQQVSGEIESINQNQRVNIIELLQNVIFELQNQIDTNQVQQVLSHEDSINPQNQTPQVDPQNNQNTHIAPEVNQQEPQKGQEPASNFAYKTEHQNNNEVKNEAADQSMQFTQLPASLLMEVLQNKACLVNQGNQQAEQAKQIDLQAIQSLNAHNLAVGQLQFPKKDAIELCPNQPSQPVLDEQGMADLKSIPAGQLEQKEQIRPSESAANAVNHILNMQNFQIQPSNIMQINQRQPQQLCHQLDHKQQSKTNMTDPNQSNATNQRPVPGPHAQTQEVPIPKDAIQIEQHEQQFDPLKDKAENQTEEEKLQIQKE